MWPILFLEVHFDNRNPYWFKLWFGAEQATRFYLNRYSPSSLENIYGHDPWQHQAIISANVDYSSAKSWDFRLKAISREMLQISIFDMCLRITNLSCISQEPMD